MTFLKKKEKTFQEQTITPLNLAYMLSHLSHVWLLETPWTVAHQAPLSMGFSRREYWSGQPFPSPGDLPHPGIKLMYVSYISCLDTRPDLKIVSLISGKNNSSPIVANRNFSHEKQKLPMCTPYRRRVNFFHSHKYSWGLLGQCLCYCVPFMKEKFLKQKTQTYNGENTDTLNINLLLWQMFTSDRLEKYMQCNWRSKG